MSSTPLSWLALFKYYTWQERLKICLTYGFFVLACVPFVYLASVVYQNLELLNTTPPSSSAPSDPAERAAYDMLRSKGKMEHESAVRSAKILKEMHDRDQQIRRGTYVRP